MASFQDTPKARQPSDPNTRVNSGNVGVNSSVSVSNAVSDLASNQAVSNSLEANARTSPLSGLPAMLGAVASKVVSDIKSSAVVQFNPVKFPTNFLTIRLNTDLNCQPSGWAKKRDLMFPNVDASSSNENDSFSPFSCLNMAHANQDLVGRVDVISSSKNIKDLLKMKYQSSPHISIMVHRLGRTLLLEEFDIHKHLVKKQTEEWQWLKSFFYNIVSKTEDRDKSRYLVSPIVKRESFSDEMYLNLIRHSFAASVEDNYTVVESTPELPRQVDEIPGTDQDLKGFHHESLWTFEDISMLIDSELPIFGSEPRRPCISLRLRDSRSPPINVLTGLDYWLDNLMSNVPEVAMCYHVNGFVQKYEVIRTEDIPHLENSNFDPQEVMAIARNIMAFIKSNAAVEGHTYWLYKSEHDDMVKLYDLTEHCKNELAEGDNPFTVPVGLLCYRVGRNLKMSGQRRSADARAMLENCLRLLDENKHSQVCADAHFHLADMWVPDRSVNDVWQDGGKLADTPSDLYDDDDDSYTDDSSQCESESGNVEKGQPKALTMKEKQTSPIKYKSGQQKNAVALQELVVRGMTKHRAWDVVRSCRIAGETDERCKMALRHIRKGLCCIDKYIGKLKPSDDFSEEQEQEDESSSSGRDKFSSSVDDRDTVRSANPFVAIPLHYTPLKSQTNQTSEGSSSESHVPPNVVSSSEEMSSQESNTFSSTTTEANSWNSDQSSQSSCHQEDASIPWHTKIKFHLLRKAAITYFVFSKQFFEIKRYGQALRHLRYALHCWESLEELKPSVRTEPQDLELHLMLFYLAATTRCSITVGQWTAFFKEFEELEEEEAAILHSSQLVLQKPKYAWVYQWPVNMEKNIRTAQQLFQTIMKLSALEKKSASFRGLLKKQYAACLMLLGNTQMEVLKERIKNGQEDFPKVKSLWSDCIENFQLSRDLFNALNDKNTSGHVCTNVAYLHILAALSSRSSSKDVNNPIGKEEKQYLLKAIDWYEKSLHLYERGEHMDGAREKIFSSLRLQYYQMACRYFEIPMASITTEHIRTMKDYLQKSLSYCHMNSVKHGKQSKICGALCHLNIARVFEVEFSMSGNNQRKRSQRQKMEENYRIAFEIYDELRWRRSQISVKDIWINSLLEELEKKSQAGQNQKKSIRTIYNHFCDLQDVVDKIGQGDSDSSDQSLIFKDDISAVKQIVFRLNRTLCIHLKMDKTNSAIKKVYERCLRLTSVSKLEDIVKQASQIFNGLREFVTSDSNV